MNGFEYFRKKNGLTQSDVSKIIKKDRSQISRWESGISCPSATVMLRLSKIYDCTMEDLMIKEVKHDGL